MATKTKQQKPRKLSKKREGFVKDYVETGNATEAAARNYPVKSRKVAQAVGSEILSSPIVQQAVEARKETLREALERKGVTSEKIADTVSDLLEATDPDGNPDYKARDKGVVHATRIRGDVVDLPPVAPQNNTYNFLNITAGDQEEIKNIEARLKARLIQPHAQTNQTGGQSV